MAPAPIVYEGVAGSGEGGTLFADLKFFIVQRVYDRQKYVDLVKNNGGKIVLLEKHADIIIADHARKDAPAGSLSYRFIEESVKKGVLETTEEHLIGRSHPKLRPVGSSQPPKTTRTRFTGDEDAALTEFVLAMERQGCAQAGNRIYQIFAEDHPNHPWQSYRDRWIKRLAFLPRPDPYTKRPEPAPNHPAPHRTVAARRPAPQATTQQIQDGGGRSNGNQIHQEPEQQPNRNQRLKRARNIDPQEPAHERVPSSHSSNGGPTRDRSLGVRGLAAAPDRTRIQKRRQEPLSSPPRSRVPENVVPNARNWGGSTKDFASSGAAAEQYTRSDQAIATAAATAAAAPAVPSSSRISSSYDGKRASTASSSREKKYFGNKTKEQVIARVRELDERKRQIRSAKLIQRTWRGYNVRQGLVHFHECLVSLQAAARGFMVRRTPQDGDAEEDEEEDEDEESGDEEEEEESPSERAQFYSMLGDFLETKDISLQHLVSMKAGGRSIDAWDLWQAVTAQEDINGVRDWEEIAEQMGFDWINNPNVTHELKRLFEEYLGEFEELKKSFEEEEREEQEAAAAAAAAATAAATAARGEEEDEPMPFPSSPPVRGQKRGFEESSPSDPPTKRPRYFPARESPHPRRISNMPPSLSEDEFPELQRILEIKDRAEAQAASLDMEPELPTMPETQYGDVSPSQQLLSESHQRFIENTDLFSPPPRYSSVNDNPAATAKFSALAISSGAAHSSAVLKAARETLPPSYASASGSSGPLPEQPRSSLQPDPAVRSSPPHQRQTSFVDLSGLPSSSSSSPPPPSSSSARSSSISPPRRSPRSGRPPSEVSKAIKRLIELKHEQTIDHFVALGYEQAVVAEALKATCASNLGVASHVMESLKQNRCLPPDARGVWTADDDAALLQHDTTDFASFTLDPNVSAHREQMRELYRQLRTKHRTAGIEKRRKFLTDWAGKG